MGTETDPRTYNVQHICTSADRLLNIERALEKVATNMEQITGIFISLARLETTLASLSNNNDDHEKRVRDLEDSLNKQQIIIRWGERIMWLAALGGLSYLGPIPTGG